MPRPRQTATDHLQLSYRDLLRASSRFMAGNGEPIGLGKIPQRRINGERSRFMAFRRLLQQAAKQGDRIATAYLDVLVHVNVTRGDAVELRSDRGNEEPYVELMWELDPMFLALVEAGDETMPSFDVTEQLGDPSIVAIELNDGIRTFLMQTLFSPEIREQGILERSLLRSAMTRFIDVPNNVPLIDDVFNEMLSKDPPWIEIAEGTDESGEPANRVFGTDEGLRQYNHQQQVRRGRGGLPS